MGNSEVGHLNIGAGRVVYQDLVKINKSIADKSILNNKEIVSAFTYAKESGKAIHFMGLTSHDGEHSSLKHLYALCDIAYLEDESHPNGYPQVAQVAIQQAKHLAKQLNTGADTAFK